MRTPIARRLKNVLKQFPFFVPMVVHSCKEWIDRNKQKKGHYRAAREDWYKLIVPTEFYHHPLPHSVEAINKKAFDNNISYITAEVYLFSLKNVFLHRHKGIILSNYNECFQEFSHHFNIQTLGAFFFKHPFYTFSDTCIEMPQTSAVLVSPESHHYYHWMFDVLPRIKLYGDVFSQVDFFYVSSAVPEKFLNVLTAFGVTKEKVKLLKDTEKLKFANLFVGSLPGSEGRSPRWAVEFIRQQLLSKASLSVTKKIYFKRGSAANRRVLNEDRIISILMAEGFNIVDPENLSIHEQVEIAQSAKIIVSAHGAALTNLVFAAEGKCSVVEIFSPDYFRTDCYYTLASILNLNYWYLTGIKPENTEWGSFLIPEEALKATLTAISQIE
jgi:hypothetical protein